MCVQEPSDANYAGAADQVSSSPPQQHGLPGSRGSHEQDAALFAQAFRTSGKFIGTDDIQVGSDMPGLSVDTEVKGARTRLRVLRETDW